MPLASPFSLPPLWRSIACFVPDTWTCRSRLRGYRASQLEINGIDWTHAGLPWYSIEEMGNKAQSRAAPNTPRDSALGVPRTSFSAFAVLHAKGILRVIVVAIIRIGMSIEAG